MAKMSAKTRSDLPGSKFAGPHRSFPVNDRAHARAAIMDSKYAANPSAVKAKAEAALRNMGAQHTGSDTATAMPSGKHESLVHSSDISTKDHSAPDKWHGAFGGK